MTLIRKFVNAMESCNAYELGQLFASDAVYIDFCPIDAGRQKYYAYGTEGIDMVRYFAVYGTFHLQAIATIQEFDEDGNIRALVVRPA